LKRIKILINKSISFKQLLLSGGTTLLYRILGLFLNFFITFFITKNYGEGIYGNYSLVFTILQASTMIFALGLPNALINYLGLHNIKDHFAQFLLRKGLKIIILTAIIPSIFYYMLKDIIAFDIFHNTSLPAYIIILALTLPFCIIHEYFLNFFIATKNFLKFNVFMFVVPNVLFLLLLLLFPITKENEHFTILFYVISVAITVIIELFFVFKKHTKTQIDKLSSKKIIQFSSPMMLSSLMLFLLNWTDVFMLGAMASEEEVGIYNIAYKLASLSMLVIISMNVVLAPKIAQLYKLGNLEELHSVIKKSTRLVTILTVPIIIFLIVFGDFVLGLFGSNFTDGKTALIIISLGVLVNVATGNVDQILNMTNNQKVLKNITISGFLLNAILNYLLIPTYGINGSAAASLITNAAFNIVCLLYIKKKLGFYTLF
jgi:O-antigen/teichoic acid export membrane protein